jgi:hypothetical protein
MARIVVISKKITPTELTPLVKEPFGDMVKFVVDLDRRVIALGGQLHADAEAVLIDGGSRQESLWGGNYFPGAGSPECIQYTSLINIRPAQGNRSMFVENAEIRARIRDLVFALIGEGEPIE